MQEPKLDNSVAGRSLTPAEIDAIERLFNR